MLRSLLTVGLIAACSTPTVAQVTDVEQMPERFIEHFRRGDLGALTSLFALDISYIPIVGPRRLDDVQEVSGYYGKVFSESRARNITFRNVRWKKMDDVAVRTADVVIDLELLDGSKRSTPSRVSFVYQQGPSGWKIAHFHGSPISVPGTGTSAGPQSGR